ncbi:MAG TPA: hypothetical protein PKY78_03265 [Candidatus Omnitrophota bacterium]|nr:hypothetical protein [Candidatus Omnitrophota bacterium]
MDKYFRKIAQLFVTVCFSLQILVADGWTKSGELPPVYSDGAIENADLFAAVDATNFSIPAHLGEVKLSYKGKSDKFVVHIQDAHCNPYAQKKIADIIGYLNTEYGFRLVNLEGGVGEYDLSVFWSMSGKEIRREVAEYFMKRGEVTGAEYFAINNPGIVYLWGVEDKDLYLANLKVYKESFSYRDEIEKYLKELSYIVDNLKRHIYSADLFEMDAMYGEYKTKGAEFRKYFDYLVNKAVVLHIGLDGFPNIEMLAKTIKSESGVNFDKANDERENLVKELNKKISRAETEEVISRTMEFKTKKITKNDFYKFLFDKAAQVNIDLRKFPALSNYVDYVSMYEKIDRGKVIDELGTLENAIKIKIYRNSNERELNLLSRNLILLDSIFEINLTKTDFRYYDANRDSFRVERFMDFYEKEAPKYKMTFKPDATIAKLDDYRESISVFYDYSFKRDGAFLKNMKFASAGKKEPGEGMKLAIIVTGGFHAENYCELLKKEDISYVSILPRFTTDKTWKNPYFELLAGETPSVQQTLRSALLKTSRMMAIASRLNPLLLDAVTGDERNSVSFRMAAKIMEKLFAANKNVKFLRVVDNVGQSVLIVDRNGDPVKTIPEGANVIEEYFVSLQAAAIVEVLENSAMILDSGIEYEKLADQTWVIRADGAKIKYTNDAYGKSNTDWFLDKLKIFAGDYIRDEKWEEKGIRVSIPGRGSDEFMFIFPAGYSENMLDDEMQKFQESLQKSFDKFTVLVIDRALTPDEEAVLNSKISGIDASYFSTSAVLKDGEEKGKTKIICPRDKIDDITGMSGIEGISEALVTKMRSVYLPMGAARKQAGEKYPATMRADWIQEDYKDLPFEEGGMLLMFAEPKEREKVAEPPIAGMDKINAAVKEKGKAVKNSKFLKDLENKYHNDIEKGILHGDNEKRYMEALKEAENYGIYARSLLGTIINELIQKPKDHIGEFYLVRGPPDAIYKVSVDAEGVFHLSKTIFYYQASDESSENTRQRFEEGVRPGQPRSLDASLDGMAANPLVGFKGINTAYGHTGADSVIKALLMNAYGVCDENIGKPADEMMSLATRLNVREGNNAVFSAEGDQFGVILAVAHVDSTSIGEDKSVDGYISRVDKLLDARDVTKPVSVKRETYNGNAFKDNKDYIDNETNTAINDDINRMTYLRMTEKDRGEDQLKKSDELLDKKIKGRRALKLYDIAQSLLSPMVAMIRGDAATYLIEPSISEDDKSPIMSLLKAEERTVGKKGVRVYARSYDASDKWFEDPEMEEDGKIMASLKKQIKDVLPKFRKDVENDKGSGIYLTRMVIPLVFKAEDTGKAEKVKEALKTYLREQGISEVDINGVVRFEVRNIEDIRYLNTTVDMITDLAGAEIDRYGEDKAYKPENMPAGLAENYLRLMEENLENFDEIKKDLGITAFSVEAARIFVTKIFFDGIMKIRKIDWEGIKQWKSNQDAILRSL